MSLPSPACPLAPLLLLGLVGCAHDDPEDIIATIDPNIATVVHVSWTTPRPTLGQVTFGEDGDLAQTTPMETEASTEHTASLIGLHGDTEVQYTISATDESGDTVESEEQVVTTDTIPTHVPTFTEVAPITNDNVGPWVLTSVIDQVGASATLLVLDRAGQVVWYWTPAGGVESVRPLADGTGVVCIDVDREDATGSTLLQVSWDGTATEIPLPEAHHDVIDLGDSFVSVRTTYQTVGEDYVGGDQVIEVSREGDVRVVWDAFDDLSVVANQGWALIDSLGYADWTHANGLAFDPGDGAGDPMVYVSMYFTEQVAKINWTTGELLWLLGGDDGDFGFKGDGGFGPQHAPELTADGIRLFDNADAGGSRVVEYALDENEGIAAPIWGWEPPEASWSPVLGDVHRFDDGSALAGWGLTGSIYAIGDDGSSQGELVEDGSNVVGQVTVVDGFYP